MKRHSTTTNNIKTDSNGMNSTYGVDYRGGRWGNDGKGKGKGGGGYMNHDANLLEAQNNQDINALGDQVSMLKVTSLRLHTYTYRHLYIEVVGYG